ncbi:MAG: hypothetical protein ACO3NK_03085 [Prochlorotrichaceae cyanobacterium]|jgi:DNA-binding XRE family transcriptional regulator
MDRSITEKYAIVRTEAKSITLSRVWFEMFLDLINAGWHRQYVFLGETHTFSSLSEFIEHKDGLEADPIALYLAVEACSKNSNFLPYSKQLLELFHKEGFNPIVSLENLKQGVKIKDGKEETYSINKPGRPATIDPVKVKEMREQGMTQQAIADELGCSREGVRDTIGVNRDNITVNATPQKTEDRGTSQDYLLRRVADKAPELLPEIGKGKKFKSARSAAIAAGIIKPKISFQVSPEESGASIASKLYQKLSKEQLIELTTQLTNLVLEDTTND